MNHMELNGVIALNNSLASIMESQAPHLIPNYIPRMLMPSVVCVYHVRDIYDFCRYDRLTTAGLY